MSINWNFQEETSKMAEDAINLLQSKINSEQPRGIVKFTASDQNDGDARAVYFYITEGALSIPTAMPGGQWQHMLYKTDNNYREELYEPVCSFLATLTNDQQYYAGISYTNSKGNDATMAVWYPVM
jgi:hypothetical protein